MPQTDNRPLLKPMIAVSFGVTYMNSEQFLFGCIWVDIYIYIYSAVDIITMDILHGFSFNSHCRSSKLKKI